MRNNAVKQISKLGWALKQDEIDGKKIINFNNIFLFLFFAHLFAIAAKAHFYLDTNRYPHRQ